MSEISCQVRFTAEHMRLFSEASGDVNPLHVSERYAAATNFGRPVVFGCLATLGCLAHAEIPAGSGIVGMEALFLRPVFADVDYSLVVIQDSSDTIAWRLQDGKMPLLSGTAKVAAVSSAVESAEPCSRAEPRQWGDGAIVSGLECEGDYAPNLKTFRSLWQSLGAKSELNSLAAWLLLFGSYFTGMEIPGAEALFHSYTFAIDDPSQAGRLHFSAKARSFKPKLRLASTAVRLYRDSALVASGSMTAFVRRERPRSTNEAITKLLPASDKLRGKVALITGGSRGLGAAIARALALQGCTVVVNYRNSTDEAEALKASLRDAGGPVELSQGDAAHPEWCRSALQAIERTHGRLDFLICNACPTPHSIAMEVGTVARMNAFFESGLPLVSVPLATFLDRVQSSDGTAVLISSSAVEAPVKEWPHYVALKCALEGLLRVASMQYTGAGFLLLRPPRLLTDMTNTPVVQAKSTAPEVIAVQLVERLLSPVAKGSVELLLR